MVEEADFTLRKKHLYLHFGAADEQAWVYVDGILAAQSTVASTGYGAGTLWVQPFHCVHGRAAQPCGRGLQKGRMKPEILFDTLPLNAIRLGGPIGRCIDRTMEQNILALDWDGAFLGSFRRRQWQPRNDYSGYIGLGKNIEALVHFAQYSGDPRIAALKDRLAREIIATQLPDGYIGNFVPEARIRTLWDLHEMVYILHALVENGRLFGDPPSLDAARRLGDYILRNRPCTAEPRHVGKLDTERAFIALAQATGDGRYRDYAVDGMDLRRWADPVAGHAYTFMNVCLAQLDLYRETPDERLLSQSRAVIRQLLDQDGLLVSGTCSLGEAFHSTQEGRGMLAESCATAYLIRLLHTLLQIEGRPLYGDMMERATHNALLAAQSPDGRRLRYFTCQEGPRAYFDKDTYCCPGNWRRIVSELPQMMVYRAADGLAVNLYGECAATLDVGGTAVQVRQETDYPNSGSVALNIEPAREQRFRVLLRIPRWCRDARVRVNGGPAETAEAGTFTALERAWKPGDRIELTLPLRARLVRGRQLQQGRVAVLRGPSLFCLNPGRQAGAPDVFVPGGKPLYETLRRRLAGIDAALGALSGAPVSLADLIAGGAGFGGGPADSGIDPCTGKVELGAVGPVAVPVNTPVSPEPPFVDCIVVPDGGPDGANAVVVSSTGVCIPVPRTCGQTWDRVRNGPVQGQTRTAVGGVDYAAPGHTMLSLHANKAITFDLAAIREGTGYTDLTFRADLCYAGDAEPTVDAAVYADGEPLLERAAVTTAPRRLDLALPAGARFLTLAVTDQDGSIAHDRVFFGDAMLAPAVPAPPRAGGRTELLAEQERLAREVRRHMPVDKVIPALALDGSGGAEVVRDATVRPDGIALKLKAWSPAALGAPAPDIELLLTEYPDPGGVATYLRVADDSAAVDDELLDPQLRQPA